MKTNRKTGLLLAFFAAAGIAGCSSMPGSKEKSGKEVAAASGPSVLNPRVSPDTVEVNKDLRPTKPAEVVAEVKDFGAPVTDVRLRFLSVPIEIKMSNISGTTWRAELTPDVVRQLAIGNQTTTYEANIYARNASGDIGVSRDPVKVAVKAPDLTQATG